MSVHYRAMRPQDLPAQRGLFRLSFPETVGTAVEGASHYEWKFREFPAAGKPASYEYVGTDGDTVAAYYAALPYPYRIEGRDVTAGMVCDVMTHPGFRGKGLFTAIGRHATDALAGADVAFVTGYPIRPEVIPGHLKVGWKVVQALPVWLRPVGTRSLLPKLLRPLSPLADAALAAVLSWARPARGYRVEILERSRFLSEVACTPAYAALLQRWTAAVPNALEKSAAFLAWRTGAPGTAYSFALLYHGDTLVGVALVRGTTLQRIECLALLDLMLDPSHVDGARSVHHALARHARVLGKDAVACMCSREWAKTYRFAGSGYFRTPAVFSLIVKRLTDAVSDDEVYAPARWHVFWIDSDGL